MLHVDELECMSVNFEFPKHLKNRISRILMRVLMKTAMAKKYFILIQLDIACSSFPRFARVSTFHWKYRI